MIKAFPNTFQIGKDIIQLFYNYQAQINDSVASMTGAPLSFHSFQLGLSCHIVDISTYLLVTNLQHTCPCIQSDGPTKSTSAVTRETDEMLQLMRTSRRTIEVP